MKENTIMSKMLGLTIVGGVLGAFVGYVYAKEVGAVLGFLIGLLIGNYFEKRR